MHFRICCFLLFGVLLFSANARAQQSSRLHRTAIVVDTHNDVLSTVTMKGLNIENDLSGKSHSDLERFRKGGVDVQIFSIFCDERFGRDTAFRFANIEIDSLYAIAKRNPDKLQIVYNPDQLRNTVSKHKIAALMGVEGGHMMEDKLVNLDSFYNRGVRYMTLTWNNSTTWATSAADESKNRMPFGSKGLTAFGKEVVKRMNELGMIVDLSHVGEQTFWDAIHTTTKPVIASHSCAYTLCPVPRNLKDEQIKAIGQNGGVIHLNFYSGFLDSNYLKRKEAFLKSHQPEVDSLHQLNLPNYEIEERISKKYPSEANAIRPPLSILLDHLDYIVKLIGVDHVGLGSDFDGIESAPQGLNGVEDFPKITAALLQRGYAKKDIRKILGGNFLRVFDANSGPRINSSSSNSYHMQISGKAFGNGQAIPQQYTCQGEDINPPLEFKEVPSQAKSLALIMDDPDAPSGRWIHWLLWNINPKTISIAANSVPAGVIQGKTSFGKSSYGGPCPPSGTHRYFFKLYAVDKTLDLSSSADVQKLGDLYMSWDKDRINTYGGIDIIE